MVDNNLSAVKQPEEIHEIRARVKIVAEDGDSNPGRGGKGLEWARTIVDLLKILAWPLLVLYFFFVVEAPLLEIFRQLPNKFSQATKVTVGSLSLEIQEKAIKSGNPALAERLGKLSAQAIEQLIRTDKTGKIVLVGLGDRRRGENAYTLPPRSALNALLELEARGLIEFREDLGAFLEFFQKLPLKRETESVSDRDRFLVVGPITSQQREQLDSQVYFLTDLGHQAYEAVVDAIADQLAASESIKQEPSLDEVPGGLGGMRFHVF
jgi:hypothetical protein